MARNDPPEIVHLISTERERFAAWLEDLQSDSWPKDTLCDGWTVLDVAGHVTFPWRVSTPRLLAQMIRHRGFDGASRAGAIGLGEIGASALAREIRSHADDVTRPPGATIHDLLAEIVVHPLDIAVPLAEPWTPDLAASGELLDYLTTSKKGSHYHSAGGVADLRFVATDLDWAWGNGAEISGSSGVLALVLAGRAVNADLVGPGVATLRARLAG